MVLKKNTPVKDTPLMSQYLSIKSQHPDALLLFRVGDFYETFGEDAIEASKILGIILTSRSNGSSKKELAGFPYHSLNTYLPKLVKAGKRVAICEQLEDPKQTSFFFSTRQTFILFSIKYLAKKQPWIPPPTINTFLLNFIIVIFKNFNIHFC